MKTNGGIARGRRTTVYHFSRDLPHGETILEHNVIEEQASIPGMYWCTIKRRSLEVDRYALADWSEVDNAVLTYFAPEGYELVEAYSMEGVE